MSRDSGRTEAEVGASELEDALPKNPRRGFLLGALSTLPATALLASCERSVLAAGPDAANGPLTHERQRGRPPERSCSDESETERRSRRLRLVDAHVGHENLRDLPGIMQTFGARAEMIMNGRAFRDAQSIAAGHVLFGMTAMPGSLANTRVIPEREYFTDDEVLVEGRVEAEHVGDVLHFPATGRRVVLHYSAFYRFDERDELISERIVMNWAPLAGG